MSLTQRQNQLLKAIVEEFIETGSPVGSVELVKKYKLGYSPATARNEMNALMRQGYLEQPHTSAGRIPAVLGYRTYLDSLFEEADLPVLQEVAIKQRLWQNRSNFEQVLRAASLVLSEFSKYLAVATTESGHVFSGGAVNILDYEEFYDIDITRSVLNLLDHHDLFTSIFDKARGDGGVTVLIGDELELPNFERCAVVSFPYQAGSHRGYLAVLGPCRLKYGEVLPLVRYVGGLIEELGLVW